MRVEQERGRELVAENGRCLLAPRYHYAPYPILLHFNHHRESAQLEGFEEDGYKVTGEELRIHKNEYLVVF